jgi:hypothetical protein
LATGSPASSAGAPAATTTLIRHDAIGKEPIEDQAAARAVPADKVRRRSRKPTLVVDR